MEMSPEEQMAMMQGAVDLQNGVQEMYEGRCRMVRDAQRHHMDMRGKQMDQMRMMEEARRRAAAQQMQRAQMMRGRRY